MFTLTIIFITYYLATLVKGNLYYNWFINYHEKLISLYKEGRTKKSIDNEVTIPAIPMTLFIVLVFILELIFFIKAISILQIPSIILLFYSILTMIYYYGKNKMPDMSTLTTEEGRIEYKKRLYEVAKKRTITSVFIALVKLSYFSYMFYLFVFIL